MKQWTFNPRAYLLVPWSCMCGKGMQGSKNVALLFSSVLTTTLVSCPDPTFSQEKMFKTFCNPPNQNTFGYLSRESTATGEVVWYAI